jgi:hypothetical protein
MNPAEYRIFDAVPADAELILNRQSGWQLVDIGPATDASKMRIVLARIKPADVRQVIDITPGAQADLG